MTHETAQQRRRRHKADPFDKQQAAPRVEPPSGVFCRCGDQQLVHDPHCLVRSCGCMEFRPRDGECGGC